MPTRFQDDDGNEYMIPSELTGMFRVCVMQDRDCPSNRADKVWAKRLPKRHAAFHGIFDVYSVAKNGKGRIVQPLARYPKDTRFRKVI